MTPFRFTNTTTVLWRECMMRKPLEGPMVLFLAGALLAGPVPAYAQDDHAGHNHAGHSHAGHEDHGPGEAAHVRGEKGHDDHDHGDDEHDEHSDEVTLSGEAIKLFNITTQLAERRVLADTITAPARVEYNAEAMAHIGTQVQGRVARILAREGDEMREGDLLMVLNSPELGAAQSALIQGTSVVDAARARVDAAETFVEVAETALERAGKLRESNSISITDYLEREGALREAQANVRLAEAELRVAESARLAAENQLHIHGYRHEDCASLLETGEVTTEYEIRAPITGRVIQREVTPGEVVSPDSGPLMVLANMDELWVLADVPERHAGRVLAGTPARVTLGAFGDPAFEGVVSYLAPHLDARTRTASVRIAMPVAAASGHEDHDHVEEPDDHESHDHDDHSGHDHSGDDGGHDHSDHAHAGHDHDHAHEDDGVAANPVAANRLLMPGMFGTAELALVPVSGRSALAVVAVPEEAIQDIEGGPAVFVPVPGEANTFAMRPVRVGARVGRWVPVLSGLEEGERYVATNTFILKAELGKEGAEHGHAH